MGKYDIFISIDSGAKPFSFGDHPTRYMSDFYKTIIKWTKCFLTERGSDLSDKNYGTTIADLLMSNVYDISTIRDVVNISIGQATQKVQEYQSISLNLSNDELLVGVRLLKFLQDSADGIIIDVEFTNANNSSMFLRLPLDIVKTRA